MPYVITSPCIASRDRSCVEVCPVDCIHEAEQMLVIDPVECIDCGACVPECPVEAIYRDDEVPAEEMPYVEINAAIVDGSASVDDLLTRHIARG